MNHTPCLESQYVTPTLSGNIAIWICIVLEFLEALQLDWEVFSDAFSVSEKDEWDRAESQGDEC